MSPDSITYTVGLGNVVPHKLLAYSVLDEGFEPRLAWVDHIAMAQVCWKPCLTSLATSCLGHAPNRIHIIIGTLANTYNNVVCLYLNPEGILRFPKMGKIKDCSSSFFSHFFLHFFLHFFRLRTNNQFLVILFHGARTMSMVLPIPGVEDYHLFNGLRYCSWVPAEAVKCSPTSNPSYHQQKSRLFGRLPCLKILFCVTFCILLQSP